MNLGMEICWRFQDQQLEKEKKIDGELRTMWLKI